MADAKVLSNQKTILANQSTIVKNQKRILANQNSHREESKDPSREPGHNQKESIRPYANPKNQKEILAAVKK